MNVTHDIGYLRSVADHAERHGLAHTIATIGTETGSVYTRREWGSSARPEFARWARSVGADTARRAGGYFVAEGALDDGTPVRVLVETPTVDTLGEVAVNEIATGGDVR